MKTSYTDIEKVKLYRERIKRAQESLDRWAPDARKLVSRYRNEAQPSDYTTEGHRISSPSGVATIDSMYSSLTAVDVEFNVMPWAHGTETHARIAERGIMEVWREQKVPRKARRTVKDALLPGIGWIKTGYDYASHVEEQDRDPQEIEADIAGIYQKAVANGEQPPPPEAAAAITPVVKKVEIVDRDRIVVDYIQWDRVLYDPSACNNEDIYWIGQISYLTPEEVKEHPAWREYVKAHTGSYKALEELKPDHKLADTTTNGSPVFVGEDVDPMNDEARIAVVEMYDLTPGGTICTFPLSGNFLLNEEPNPFGFNEDMEDRNPFVPLVLRDDPERVRGISDMGLIEPSLRERNRYRSGLINYLEHFHSKTIGPERAMTEAGRAAFEKRGPAHVGLDEGFTAQDIQPLDPPQLPSELFNMPQRIEDEIREATGVSEIQRGIFPDRKRTATETTEVVAASSARQSEKRALMEDFYTDIAKRILQLMQTFYTEERIARLVEDEGDTDFVFNAEDIAMEADLEIVLSPKQPRDQVWKEERAMKLINFVGSLPEANRPNLIKKALRDMGYSDQEIREVINLPEEQQAQRQEEIDSSAAEAAAVAEAQAVGQASGDPNIPGGVNGPDPLSDTEVMGPAGVMATLGDETAGALDYIAGP